MSRLSEKINRLSLRSRVFISLLILVLLASVFIAGITVIHFKNQTDKYHRERLLRKEAAIKKSIEYVIFESIHPVTSSHLEELFENEIYRISDVHSMSLGLYNLNGELIKKSDEVLFNEMDDIKIPELKLDSIYSEVNNHFIENSIINDKIYQSSFSTIFNSMNEKIGILLIKYVRDDSSQDEELKDFLISLVQIYLFLIFIAVVIALWLSRFISGPIMEITDKIGRINLNQTNEKISLKNKSKEISLLTDSYNNMLIKLKESVLKLAEVEREQAWREMAKQIAHEIRNPLTPMKLNIQNFEIRFDSKDKNIEDKVKTFCESLLQQIDTLTSISTAFSTFADMPIQKNESLNMVEVIKLALDIFDSEYIEYEHNVDNIIYTIDRTQLIRLITNLVKNAFQSVSEDKSPKIKVQLIDMKSEVRIEISDNGKGINEENWEKIWEPKFTTKTSGVGLGLPMVKKIVEAYKGNIYFESSNNGTNFYIKFPKK